MHKKKRFMDISQKNYGGVIFSLSYAELISSLLIVEKKSFHFFFSFASTVKTEANVILWWYDCAICAPS